MRASGPTHLLLHVRVLRRVSLLQQVQLSVVAVAQRRLVHPACELRRHLSAQLLLQRRGLDGLVGAPRRAVQHK